MVFLTKVIHKTKGGNMEKENKKKKIWSKIWKAARLVNILFVLGASTASFFTPLPFVVGVLMVAGSGICLLYTAITFGKLIKESRESKKPKREKGPKVENFDLANETTKTTIAQHEKPKTKGNLKGKGEVYTAAPASALNGKNGTSKRASGDEKYEIIEELVE